MARKLIAFTILLACSPAFGIALLCKMPCCPESRMPAMQMPGDVAQMPMHVMPMANHQHLPAMTGKHTSEQDYVAGSSCTVAFKAPQPQIVRDNLAVTGSPHAGVSPTHLSVDLTPGIPTLNVVAVGPLFAPAAFSLRI